MDISPCLLLPSHVHTSVHSPDPAFCPSLFLNPSRKMRKGARGWYGFFSSFFCFSLSKVCPESQWWLCQTQVCKQHEHKSCFTSPIQLPQLFRKKKQKLQLQNWDMKKVQLFKPLLCLVSVARIHSLQAAFVSSGFALFECKSQKRTWRRLKCMNLKLKVNLNEIGLTLKSYKH